MRPRLCSVLIIAACSTLEARDAGMVVDAGDIVDAGADSGTDAGPIDPCAGDAGPECGTCQNVAAPPLGMCFGSFNSGSLGWLETIEGAVTVSRGRVDGGCYHLAVGEVPDALWVTLDIAQDDGGQRQVQYAMPTDAGPLLANGERVMVTSSFRGMPYSDWAFRVERAAEPLVYLFRGAGPSGTTPYDPLPPLPVRTGDWACSDHDGCGGWRSYELLVDFDGGTQRIANRGTAEIDSWLVGHVGGGKPDFSMTCADWHPPRTTVGFIRLRR